METIAGPDAGRTDIRSLLPTLPRWLRLLNAAASPLDRVGALWGILSIRSMRAEARIRTGLSDWGDDDLDTPLKLLTQPNQPGARMTFAGQCAHRDTLVNCLINRLRIQDAVKRDPGIAGEQVVKPLIVVGMPRTGSTLLQRLLSQDTRCRPLLCWEAFHPAPPPHPDTHAADPRIKTTRKQLRRLFGVLPELASMHYMDAVTPEECEWLLHNTLVVPGFFAAVPEFPQFHTWCRRQDFNHAYRYYRLQLQILQRHFPPAHWVLKGNEHMGYLDALLAAFPDACIVHTHRDPLKSVASCISLTLRLFGLKYKATEAFLAESGQRVMNEYARILEQSLASRRQGDPARYFDVFYPDLLADPLRVVARIYDHFGYAYDQDTEDRMRKWLDANPQTKHGVHRYSLEAFGLSAASVLDRTQAYCDHYRIARE